MFTNSKITAAGKQYSIRANTFEEKEPEIPDAVLSEGDELFEIAKLAGIGNQANMNAYSPDNKTWDNNPSIVANNKIKQQQENNIQPGTPEWFRLWFGATY